MIISQRTLPFANEKLGNSKYYIHAYGGQVTLLSEIVELPVNEVNKRLTEQGGFTLDESGEETLINWEKIEAIFPEYKAIASSPYDNAAVVSALGLGNSVIVSAKAKPDESGRLDGLMFVRYVGNGICHDPFTGTERPTNDFPSVTGFVVVIKKQTIPSPTQGVQTVSEKPVEPAIAEEKKEDGIAPGIDIAEILTHLDAIRKLLGI